MTDAAGEVTIEVPPVSDRHLQPSDVRKRQRRAPDVDAVEITLYAEGLATGAVSAIYVKVRDDQVGNRPLYAVATEPQLHSSGDAGDRPVPGAIEGRRKPAAAQLRLLDDSVRTGVWPDSVRKDPARAAPGAR